MEPAGQLELYPGFLKALAQHRDALNSRFALRRRAGARISEAGFMDHLRDVIAPLVQRVHDILPERASAVLHCLFDISLELFSLSLLGDHRKHPYVEALWREVLPSTAPLLAREPQRVAGCLSNALHNLALQSGTRPGEWITNMQQAAASCDSVRQLLAAATASAWRSGMAQYRRPALAELRQIPPALAAKALGVSSQCTPAQWSELIQRLAADPWLAVNVAMQRSAGRQTSLGCVAVAGAFRGFGGVLMRPPLVACRDGSLCLSDGETQWQLLADVYGTCFHRMGDAVGPWTGQPVPKEISLDAQGNLRWGLLSEQFPQLASSTSLAYDGATLAVTTATSHHVYLLAKRESPL